MNIGMVGLGKLGLPVAIALSSKHEVFGYDKNPKLMRKREYEYHELGPRGEDDFQHYFDKSNIKFVGLEELVNQSEIIFISVQTPHDSLYEGCVRAPDQAKDFDYSYIIKSAREISEFVTNDKIVIIVSTVLPGTVREYLLPILNNKCILVYHPLFISMGNVLKDYFNPEFVLLGSESDDGLRKVIDFYIDFYGKDLSAPMSVESAELCKVYYNTFITSKITLANTLMEMCHKIPNANCDDIMSAIGRATDRIISTKYLRGGMGDSGACFPPDELIMTKEGSKPICDITPGTMVLTIDGTFAPVMKRWKRQYDGDLVKIQVEGMPSVRATVEHPLYVREDLRSVKSDGKREIAKPILEQLGELKPIDADKLEVDKHFAAWPIIEEQCGRPDAIDDHCIINNHRMRRINMISREYYSGLVYNLWVDHPTHTFVTNAGAQANCHPRDLIAMSNLSERLDLSFDTYKFLIKAREAQTEWLARLIKEHSGPLPVVLLGKAFKADVSITTGSCAILLSNILNEMGVKHTIWDPYVDDNPFTFGPSLFFVSTNHKIFKTYVFPTGSTVIDPHRYIDKQDGINVIQIGVGI